MLRDTWYNDLDIEWYLGESFLHIESKLNSLYKWKLEKKTNKLMLLIHNFLFLIKIFVYKILNDDFSFFSLLLYSLLIISKDSNDHLI